MITIAGSSTASLAKAERTTRTEEDRLKEACQGFEAIFVHQMLKTMRNATIDGGLIKKSNAEKIFTDMFDQEMADIQAKSSRNGIADMLFEQLKSTLGHERPESEKQNPLRRGGLPGAYAPRKNESSINTVE